MCPGSYSYYHEARVGGQRIRPAMVCVQVELSRCMERVQVASTGFHFPLMAYGEVRGSPEIGDEATFAQSCSLDYA